MHLQRPHPPLRGSTSADPNTRTPPVHWDAGAVTRVFQLELRHDKRMAGLRAHPSRAPLFRAALSRDEDQKMTPPASNIESACVHSIQRVLRGYCERRQLGEQRADNADTPHRNGSLSPRLLDNEGDLMCHVAECMKSVHCETESALQDTDVGARDTSLPIRTATLRDPCLIVQCCWEAVVRSQQGGNDRLGRAICRCCGVSRKEAGKSIELIECAVRSLCIERTAPWLAAPVAWSGGAPPAIAAFRQYHEGLVNAVRHVVQTSPDVLWSSKANSVWTALLSHVPRVCTEM